MPPMYKSVCACGEVELELTGAPRVSFICYCQDCTAAVVHVDDKARSAGTTNITAYKDKENDRGAYCCVWTPNNIRFVKGQEKMCGFKKAGGKVNTRTYASCCNTSLIMCGGKESVGVRPINGNTLVDSSGQPFRPTAIGRVQTTNAVPADIKGAPKDGVKTYKKVPLGLVRKLLPVVLGFVGGAGSNKGDTTIGLYNSISVVTEELGEKEYRAAGHLSGW